MKQTDTIWVLETNIDDCSGEVLGYTLERLLENGARDAFYRPIYMKKKPPRLSADRALQARRCGPSGRYYLF